MLFISLIPKSSKETKSSVILLKFDMMNNKSSSKRSLTLKEAKRPFSIFNGYYDNRDFRHYQPFKFHTSVFIVYTILDQVHVFIYMLVYEYMYV